MKLVLEATVVALVIMLAVIVLSFAAYLVGRVWCWIFDKVGW